MRGRIAGRQGPQVVRVVPSVSVPLLSLTVPHGWRSGSSPLLVPRVFGPLISVRTILVPRSLPASLLSSTASSSASAPHHSGPTSERTSLAGTSLSSVLSGGLLGLPEDGSEVHGPVLREEPGHLLPHPGHDLLTVPAYLDWLALVPRVVQMLHLQPSL